jgi:hypothetical protein
MVRGVEKGAIGVMQAEGLRDIDAAYAYLSYSRKFLYEYLEALEEVAEVDPSDGWTHLRFT